MATQPLPLIESRMTRKDCLDWLKSHGYPKPRKSACVGCPLHSDAMWRSMRSSDRAAWDDAAEMDRAIRTGLRGIRGEVFLHRSGVPLEEADLQRRTHGQLHLWRNACEGMCGL